MAEQAAIATDGTNIYWADSAKHAVLECPLTGCPSGPKTVAVAGANGFISAVAAAPGMTVVGYRLVDSSGTGAVQHIQFAPK